MNPLDTPCPRCGARPGQTCRTPRGKQATGTHLARRDPHSDRLTRPNHGGRTPLLTPELTDTIANTIRLGLPLTLAAQAAGISYTTLRRWIIDADTEPEPQPHQPPPPRRAFRDAVARARAEGAALQASRINQMAQRHLRSEEPMVVSVNGEPKPVYGPDGKPLMKRVWEQDWRASAWLLERAFPLEFGRRDVVELGRAAEVVEGIASPQGGSLEGAEGQIVASIAAFRARRELEAGGDVVEGEVVGDTGDGQ